MALIVQLHEGLAVNKCPLDQPRLRIGRSPECDIFIDDAVVSSEHAVIEKVENQDSKGSFDYFLEDQNSTNGTFLNDEKTTRQKLNHEDVIRIGWASFKFIDESKMDPEKTAKIHKSWIPGVFYTKQ
jgi:pSer/pThr/pTyr-binding forkhead associated (FHA) protein